MEWKGSRFSKPSLEELNDIHETTLQKILAGCFLAISSVLADLTGGMSAEQVASIVAYLKTVK